MRKRMLVLGLAAMSACTASGSTSTGSNAAAAIDAVDAGSTSTDAAANSVDGAATGDVAAEEKPEQACPSGEKWLWGNEGSPLMHPGGACVSCHKSDWEAPKLLFAGTVYTGLHTEDDCNSTAATSGEPVTVELTDANGKVFQANVNAAGNFFVKSGKNGSLATPYTARVVQGSKERKMFGAQTSGDCNSCHTQQGSDGAPGRIRIP